jgi:transcriptional regulator with XRE-family HTH domain
MSTTVRPRMSMMLRQLVGRNVRCRRQKLELTLQAAAEYSGIHWRHWQKIEGGEVNATLETLARVARALGVETYMLLQQAIPLPRNHTALTSLQPHEDPGSREGTGRRRAEDEKCAGP